MTRFYLLLVDADPTKQDGAVDSKGGRVNRPAPVLQLRRGGVRLLVHLKERKQVIRLTARSLRRPTDNLLLATDHPYTLMFKYISHPKLLPNKSILFSPVWRNTCTKVVSGMDLDLAKNALARGKAIQNDASAPWAPPPEGLIGC
jgi:hypothetical protein